MGIRNKVQLITYPDSLGMNLAECHYVMKKYLSRAIGGVHLLPFYPSSADRGFSPMTYDEVDPVFGTWEDVKKIARDFELIVDFMVNHISRQSEYFQDYIEKGEESEYADLFLSFRKFSPDGEISEEDLGKVYVRKPRLPYWVLTRPDGSEEKIWCTFDYEQIDLDYRSPKTREIMRQFILRLARCGAKMIRLDAIGYTTVKLGTDCFFLEPEIWELLNWIRDLTEPFDVLLLPEVHKDYTYQMRIAEKGYWVYDFALPFLVINALYHHTSSHLQNWLNICPRRQLTTLDTHDGIGVVDVGDLLSPEEVGKTVQGLYDKGSNIKPIYSGQDYDNLDIYQINCTYYSALENNDDSYMTARTLQFFTPGVPQVYYVGLLAGENDVELVEETKVGRNINRHNYSLEEVESAFQKPVVKRLLKLMEFRNTHPAFDGSFDIESSPEHHMRLRWTNGSHEARAFIDLQDYKTRIEYTDPHTLKKQSFAV